VLLLERPRVAARVRAAIDAMPLVFVAAPLGFAKTSTVKAALDGGTVAWYEAAPWDADGFIEPLVMAVRRERPDFGRQTLALAEQHADPQRVGAAFASDLRHVEAPLVIVIDDAHHLDEAGFGPFIDALVRRLPEYVHLVIVSRRAPVFGLAGLVAHERAAVIGAADLRLERNEIGALAVLLEKRVTAVAIDELGSRTEGWPAGVALALRAGVQSIPSIDGTLEATSAYLVEQLVRTLDPAEIVLLESLAVYQHVDAMVIDGLALDGALAVLSGLERQGAMIERPASGGYRIHPMLGSVMRDRVRERDGAAALAAMHVRAGSLYAQAGRAAPAVFHFERAGDARALRAFLRAHTIAAVISVNPDRISALVARMEGDGIRDEALTAYIAGWNAKQHGTDEARERFTEAVRVAGRDDDAAIGFAARAQIIEGDMGRGEPVERAAIDDLLARAQTLGPAERMGAAIRAGWHAVLEGRFTDGLRFANESPDDGTPVHRYYVAPLRAYAHTALGRFDEAEAEANALTDALDQSDSLVLRASGLVWAARFALLRSDTVAAWDYAREAERASNLVDRQAEAAALYIAIAEAATHNGDAVVAQAAAEKARAFADAAWYSHDRLRTRALAAQYIARAAAIRGDFRAALTAADAALKESMPSAQTAALCADIAWYAVLATDATAPKRKTAAYTALANARALDLSDAAAIHSAFDALATIGVNGDAGARQRVLDATPFAAFVSARSTRTATDPRFETLLAHLIAKKPAPVHAASDVLETLTPRESEILSLLVLGLTNKEIAQRLVVSPRTVETHVERVLGKLGVNTRSRAIAKAVRSGLVSVAEDV
jgi:LuxR family maltose regulon positive regulatory protein